ncbi:MAG TPA: alpha/beta hydrolase [Ohtaekwangia sp.]|nr:alpha/beta hydrolase [Ohtaekwangia sp.]
MSFGIVLLVVLILIFHPRADLAPANTLPMETTTTEGLLFKSGYSDVSGIRMYYETYGQGKPLILIHGGGSTIQTTFGRIIPQLAKHRQVIALELQAHGRTSDRNNDISFEQDADDIVGLLNNLAINKADFFGFSNGGTTALQIAIRYPGFVDKLIVASALYKRRGAAPAFWEFMKQAKLEHMPQPYKDAYKAVALEPENLHIMHDKCAKRMVTFQDIEDEQIKSIKAKTLIIIADKDVMTPEHAVEMYRLIDNSQLCIIPGGHGEYIGEITTLRATCKDRDFVVPLIEKFLDSIEA